MRSQIRLLDLHKDLYRPFGEINWKNKGREELLKKYFYNLYNARSKSEFDHYKGYYRLTLKQKIVQECYAMIALKRKDLMPTFTDWAMLPFVHEGFCKKYGKISLTEFVVLCSIYYSHKTRIKQWKGVEGFTKHTVKLESYDFTEATWNKAIKWLLDKKAIIEAPDQEMIQRVIRTMTATHKHPYLKKIEKDTVYIIRMEGRKMFNHIMGFQADFLDRRQHNMDFISLKEMSDQDKLQLKDAKKIFKKWTRTTKD